MKPFIPKWYSILVTAFLAFLFIFPSITIANAPKDNADLSKYEQPIYGPSSELAPLDQYKSSSKEDPFTIAQKIDEMIGNLSGNVSAMVSHPSVTGDVPSKMMDQAGSFTDDAQDVYKNIHSMYSDVQSMEGQLDGNTGDIKAQQKENMITASNASEYNANTSSMASKVGDMRRSLSGMKDQISSEKEIVDGMPDILDEMKNAGSDAVQYYDKLGQYIKEVSGRFNSMDNDLKAQGLDASGASDQVRQYLSGLQDFVNNRKPFGSQEIHYINDVKKYLLKTSDYLDQTLSNINKVDKNLSDIQLFFINSKAHPGQDDRGPPDLAPNAAGPAADACSGVIADDEKGNKALKNPTPLTTLDSCQKSCHTVCQQKARTSGGQGCFKCPSGSPDTCYDIGAFPADISWCQPGGICATDPELYCAPFGALGPNKMHLNCTVCKQAPDECWSKIGNNTTNLTHCRQTCPGLCVYEGKYKLSDKPTKFMHCYSCKTAIPAPTCESLGWGSSTLNMCLKDCVGGECTQVRITIGKDGKAHAGDVPPPGAPPGGAPNGGDNGGQNSDNPGGIVDNGQGGNNQGGANQTGGAQGGQTGGQSGGGDQGNQPNPPTDNPQGGGGGPSTVAGGGGKPQGPTGPTGPTSQGPNTNTKPADKGSVDQPPKPKSTEAKDPGAPKTGDKPKPPDPPKDNPPDSWDVNFYTRWLDGTKERIKTRDDIINNPNESEGVKTIARQQKADMTKTKDYLETKVKEAQDKVKTQQKEIDDKKKMIEDYEKTLPKTEDYAKEAERRGKEWKLKELKKSSDALLTKVKEAKESIKNRKERIDKMTKDIDLLKKENDYLKTGEKDGSLEGDFVEDKVKQNDKKIAELTNDRNELAKQLNKTVAKYNEEISQLKSDYQRDYWRLDENARRKAEVARMADYMTKVNDKRRAVKAKQIRDKVFDDIRTNLKNEQTKAKDAGDTSKADDLQKQIDNLDRGQKTWDDQQDKRIANMDEDLYRTGQRNFNEGAGPYSEENLGEKYQQYIGYVDKNIADVNKALADGTITKTEADKELNDLNEVKNQFVDQLNYYKSDYPMTQDDANQIATGAARIANTAMGTDEDKSFVRLFGESLAEEMVHNMNPLVVLKKSWAFGTGFVSGVATGVGDVANIGYQGLKTVAQAAAVDMGFDNGGIFGTDNLDAMAALGGTISSNSNFDLMIKGINTVGKAMEDQMHEMEKGDIDKTTANFGGKVAGNIVGNEIGGELAAKAIGTAVDATKTAVSGLVKGTEETTAATKVVDEAAGTLSTGEKAATEVPKTEVPNTEVPKTEGVTQEPKAPNGPEGEGTQSRAPPEKPAPEVKEPPKAVEYDNTKPLPDVTTQSKPLDNATLTNLEEKNGFRKDHAERMNTFAQEKKVYLIVRDGNPDSVKFFGDNDKMAKPMTSKAKTAKVGPDIGLVVDPTHPKQVGYWDQAIADAEKAGDAKKLDKLTKAREKALKAWKDYGDGMLHHGYSVNPDTGVIEYTETLPDGSTKTYKGVHGDYDLHGVYKANPDGTVDHVSYGSGNNLDANHVDTEGTALRAQLNDAITGGNKDFIQHGAQDDWIPDPKNMANKTPDPPATVFFPDGRPPVTLNNAQEMKDFYEKVMGVKYPYSDEAVAKSMKATAQGAE